MSSAAEMMAVARALDTGKQMPAAVYLHRSALDVLSDDERQLVEELRPDWANVLKLNKREPLLSWLAYPRFDTEAFPRLERAATVRLESGAVTERRYRTNPPILHRKELLLHPDDERVVEWEALTRQAEQLGLFEHPHRIGTLRPWRELLASKGLVVVGHRIERVDTMAKRRAPKKTGPSKPSAKLKLATVEDLISDPVNARKRNERNRAVIDASLRLYGAARSVVIDSKGVVRAGNGTVEAARRAGIKRLQVVDGAPDTLVVVRRSDWSEDEARGYALADNRSAELAEWDLPVLEDVVASQPPDDMAAIGLDSFDLDTLLAPLDKPEPKSRDQAGEDALGLSSRLAAIAVDPADIERLQELAGYKTAINRTKASAPIAWLKANNMLVGDVLDYGAGRDVHRLTRYDPAWAPDLDVLTRTYDTIVCNYVLNVIPLEHNRVELLLALRSLLRPGGRVLVSVFQKHEADTKSSAGFQSGWERDDWSRLFARFYQAEQLDAPSFWGWRLTVDTSGA